MSQDTATVATTVSGATQQVHAEAATAVVTEECIRFIHCTQLIAAGTER